MSATIIVIHAATAGMKPSYTQQLSARLMKLTRNGSRAIFLRIPRFLAFVLIAVNSHAAIHDAPVALGDAFIAQVTSRVNGVNISHGDESRTDSFRRWFAWQDKKDRRGLASVQLAQASKEISLGEAIAIAKRRYPGEVLSARRAKDSRGQTVYIIKMLSKKGVVKKVRINAQR